MCIRCRVSVALGGGLGCKQAGWVEGNRGMCYELLNYSSCSLCCSWFITSMLDSPTKQLKLVFFTEVVTAAVPGSS